jgi:hypothetical protein
MIMSIDPGNSPPAEALAVESLPTICEAERVSGPSGAILKGAELTFDEAVSRRQAGKDVVVCGADVDANRHLAGKVEAAVGLRTGPQKPHTKAGPHALPHFHQVSRDPDGHCFYETDNPRKKARTKP